MNHAKGFFQNLEKHIDPKEIQDTEEKYQLYKEQFKEPVCKKCKTFRTQFSWSTLDLLSMAKKADYDLENLYFPGYFFPTIQTHATPSSFMSRLEVKEDGNISFAWDSQREWSDRAMIAAHNIMLRVMLIQDKHFNLGLDDEIEERGNDFLKTWKSYKPEDSKL